MVFCLWGGLLAAGMAALLAQVADARAALFGGLLFAAVMFMMGQTERMIYGLIGALIGGLSFLIVKAMFSSSDSNASDLSLGTTS